MRIISLVATLILTIINIHTAQADTLVKYNVKQTYSDTTTFSGSFIFNYTKNTITNLSGILYDNAMHAKPLSLTYQPPSKSDGNGGILASVYLLKTTKVFAPGSNTMTAGNNNASVTIDVKVTNPLLGPTSLGKLSYADCTPGGLMMGKMCTTGNIGGGTMGGRPTSEKILPSAGLYDGIWRTSGANPKYFSLHEKTTTGQLILIDADSAGGPAKAYSGVLSGNKVQLKTIFFPSGCSATATVTFQSLNTLSYTIKSLKGNCGSGIVGVPRTATKIF